MRHDATAGRVTAVARPSANKDTVTEIKGMRQLLRLLNQLPKDLQAEVRDASQEIANDLVSGAKNAAHTRQQSMAAAGLKVKRDRVPIVRVGRNTIRPGVKETDVFYGAEFGGRRRPTTMQFQPHLGQQGYFLYPTARQRGRKYAEMWAGAVDKAFRDWDYKAPH